MRLLLLLVISILPIAITEVDLIVLAGNTPADPVLFVSLVLLISLQHLVGDIVLRLTSLVKSLMHVCF